jgi:hypothetical protein
LHDGIDASSNERLEERPLGPTAARWMGRDETYETSVLYDLYPEVLRGVIYHDGFSQKVINNVL